jgi:hypothetical protein
MRFDRKELMRVDPVLGVMYWFQYVAWAGIILGVWILTPWFPWK